MDDSASRSDTVDHHPPADSIVGGIAQALESARRVISDLFRLLSLEVRRAGLALMWMVVLGVMAAVLMVTAWLGLMAALALWAVSLGASWMGAILVIALVNILLATVSLVACLTMSRDLLFPATQRQLDP
jgi:uncharacterized membrane protein YqjE